METKTLWMPPVWFLVQALAYQVLGPSFESLRLLSSSVSFFLAVSYFYLLRRLGLSYRACSVGFALLLFEPLFFRFGTTGRMESLTAFFFVTSLLSLPKHSRGTSSLIRFFFSGLLLSCSLLSHPFALFLMPVFLAFLIFENPSRFKVAIWLTIGFSIPILCWVSYIHPDWEILFLQMKAQLIRKQTLVQKFTLLDKIKIFAFGFGFSNAKVSWIFGLIVIGFLRFVTLEVSHRRIWILLWIWLFFVGLGIFLSSEGWYVFHFLLPLSLLAALLWDLNFRSQILISIGITIALLAQMEIAKLHWIDTNSAKIWRSQIDFLSNVVEKHNKIYLQSLPDPYFELQKIFPEKTFLEFVPGELEFPSDSWRNTTLQIDLFIFHREDSIPPIIKNMISDQIKFRRTSWKWNTPTKHWLNFESIIYERIKY